MIVSKATNKVYNFFKAFACRDPETLEKRRKLNDVYLLYKILVGKISLDKQGLSYSWRKYRSHFFCHRAGLEFNKIVRQAGAPKSYAHFKRLVTQHLS
ncbi:hypothetical protein OSTOST_02050, partial [Ostertagia ostertagi]